MKGWAHQGRRKVAEKRIADWVKELERSYVTHQLSLTISGYVTSERLPLSKTYDLERKSIEVGELWGRNWQSLYALLECELPPSHRDRELAVYLDLGGEILLYGGDENPFFSLTDRCVHDPYYHKEINRIGKWEEKVLLYAEVAANGLFGLDRNPKKYDRSSPTLHGDWSGQIKGATVGIFDEEVYRLYMQSEVLFDLYRSLDPLSTRAIRLLSALFEAATLYSVHSPKVALASLAPELAKGANASALSTVVVGHAHIDTAWLWPIAETRRKVVRTFASQIDNLHRYEKYQFGASSPQHYQWVKESSPILWRQIKEEVAKKRWELLGAMWVEPDCSLVSGESLVRHIVEGQKFYEKEFGVRVNNCWIPDVFGYPASLPQILQKANIPYFLTQKLSWNGHTQFPYESFIWEGIDGSEVITHFLPERTYNSSGTPGALISAERNFLEKDRLDEFITALGIGDGGGGPTDKHIDRILLAENLEGVPKASFGRVRDFFERLGGQRELLERYRGELYLELHRGTLTSQAMTKRNNRLFEETLRLFEALVAEEAEYPHAELEAIIRDGLTLQFHDILPGSSIKAVYDEAGQYYERIFSGFLSLLERYFSKRGIKRGFATTAFGKTGQGDEGSYLSLFTPTSFEENRLVRVYGLNEQTHYLLNDTYHLTPIGSSHYSYLPLSCSGWNTFTLAQQQKHSLHDTSLVVENDLIRYEFDDRGALISAKDRMSGREYMESGRGNDLILYIDEPQDWEAWELDYYYHEQRTTLLKCTEARGLGKMGSFSLLKFGYETPDSIIEQYVLLPHSSKELYFVTTVDWQETRKLLRVEFPVDRSIEWALCDIPYGLLKRKTHVQTEEDFAKFEFGARGFVAVGDEDGGVALASDSKYGYSCRDGVLGMSLLRAPLDPDPTADIGTHRFTYAFIPYSGPVEKSNVRIVSDALNDPSLALCTPEPVNITAPMPVQLQGGGVAIHVIKRSEDQKSILFRAVESWGKRKSVILQCSSDLRFVECNLLEEEVGEEIFKDQDELHFSPFEIRTFKTV